MSHNIVILGGNFSGVSAAHYLLRHVLPLLNSSDSKKSYKVTLVSPSDRTFFKVGAPRALMASTKSDLLKPFSSIPEAFSHYPTDTFTFILGSAVALDEHNQTITVKTEKAQSVHYDSLVIATGTTSNSPLWTLHNSLSETTSAFEELNASLDAAKTILISGGGPTGVEISGELGNRFKGQNKTITLLSGTSSLLPRLNHASVSKKAQTQLYALGVQTIHNFRVIHSKTIHGGKTEVDLSDGSKKVVDLFVDATGGRPNTTFIPTSWLDANKRVVTTSTDLRTPTKNVYALGDVASFSLTNAPDSMWPVNALGYSIYSDLTNGKGSGLKEKKYKQITASMGIIPIGPGGGVGVVFGWGIPSWLVWLVKSRDFMMAKAPELATGAAVLKA